jgi:hypothetical protein
MDLAIKREEYVLKSSHDAAVQRVILTFTSTLGNVGKSVGQKVQDKPPGVAAEIIQAEIDRALAEMQRAIQQSPPNE